MADPAARSKLAGKASLVTRAVTSGNGKWLWFTAIVLFSLLLRAGIALTLPNIKRPDEIFQNLEPAYRMVSGHGVLTWEWREGIRSPMFPGFLAGLIGLSERFGLGARGYLTVISVVMSLLASGTAAVGFLLGWCQARLTGAIVTGVVCAVWADLVYLGPKTLTEVQAGNLLIIAAYLTMPATSAADIVTARNRLSTRMVAIGLLLGLTFCVRFQLAPGIGCVALWAGRLDLRRRWLPLIAGGFIPVVLMGLVDLFYWGTLFQSVTRNWQLNVFEGISNEFGAQPFYYYVGKFVGLWGAAIVPVALAAAVGLPRAPLLGLVAAAIFLSHSAIAHKEMSFVYAALPPLFVLAGLGTTNIISWLTQLRPLTGGTVAAIAASVFWVVTSFTTALNDGFRSQWHIASGVLHAEAAIRNDPELCGLGLSAGDVGWYFTGGDVYLGRPIPIYVFGTPMGMLRVATAANYVIGGEHVIDGLPGFSIKQCWDDPNGKICLARARSGATCTPDPDLDLNNVTNLGRVGTRYGADRP